MEEAGEESEAVEAAEAVEETVEEVAEETEEDATTTNVPVGWEDRQRNRDVQAKQFGVFSSKNPQPQSTAPTTLQTATNKAKPSSSNSSAEAALVKVAATTLDTMAQCLEQNPVALSQEERAAFAAAMQRAMAAIAKCR